MMKFKVGDTVLVLDEDMSGVIKKISGDVITIESEDGFDLEFSSLELIKTDSSTDLRKESFSNTSANDIVKQKESYRPNKSLGTKVKKRSQPALVIDLHIDKLIDSTKGMTNFDMLNLQVDTAKQQLEFAMRKRIQRVVFIHGVGEGVLKMELQSLFRRYDNLKYYEANPRQYGLGATEIYIFQNINP